VDDRNLPAQQFEANRPHLRAVALRMLGNTHDADDALQDAWLRVSNAHDDEIANVTGWLTTVVTRVCPNTLRTRQRRPLSSFPEHAVDLELAPSDTATPEDQAILADSMGLALLIVLETLSPAERICFVLHDMFSLPFDEIGEMLAKSPDACRQLASRARRRVGTSSEPVAEPQLQRDVVDAFLVAARGGDFQTLLSLLSPDVELVADPSAVAMGAPERKDGPFDVATRFSGGARAARVANLDGRAGLVWAYGGTPKVAFDFTIVNGEVTRIDMIGDPDVLEEIQIESVRTTKAR
jgi:RNA polymerase sigma factor (sigma-70 family)